MVADHVTSVLLKWLKWFVGLVLFYILLFLGDVNNSEVMPELFNLAFLILLQNVLRILLLYNW